MASARAAPPPIALTMGDPAGIGPDITLLAWAHRSAAGVPRFVVLGNADVFRERSRMLGLDVPVETLESPGDAAARFDDALPVYSLPLPDPVTPGAPDAAHAQAVMDAIETGVAWTRDGRAAALVTNPVNKQVLYRAGFPHPGHTEYLAALCAGSGPAPRPVMMLASESLRVIPVTIHIPLRDVPGALTGDLIVETAEIAARSLTNRFGIAALRIAVTGLNPHAGEGGALGTEENEIIAPAIARLKDKGIAAEGPFPADSVFQERVRADYDAIIAMYHDQALAPIKALAFDETVNVTLGLPIIRTGPDHGTAYGLAGTGKASPGSLIASLRLAERLAAREKAPA